MDNYKGVTQENNALTETETMDSQFQQNSIEKVKFSFPGGKRYDRIKPLLVALYPVNL